MNFSIIYFQLGKLLEGLRKQTLSGISSFSSTGSLQGTVSPHANLGVSW